MKKLFSRLWDFIQDAFLENLCRYGLLAIILLAFLEVIRRYFFGHTFLWYQDVAVYFNLTVVFLYFGSAQRKRSHIRLDVILAVLKRRGSKYDRLVSMLEMLSALVSIVICVVFVWVGIGFVQTGIAFGRKTDNANLLLWPFYILLLVGFALLTVELVISFFSYYRELRGGGNS